LGAQTIAMICREGRTCGAAVDKGRNFGFVCGAEAIYKFR